MSKVNESMENYLETILILQQNNKEVRMSDVATHLAVSKPSVNKAMRLLKEEGYIQQEVYGTISLTDSGMVYAKKVYERHLLFRRFFIEILEVDPIVAEEEACHMEHCVSDATMKKLKAFLVKVMDSHQKK